MKSWSTEDELFTLMRKHLFTAVVGDVMDQSGLQHQFLSPAIQPILPEMMLVGRAMPVLVDDLTEQTKYLHEQKPFGLMLEALDDLHANEVYIASGASPAYALWGELMSTRAMKLKATGAVLNGYHRDTDGIIALNFPTFSMGSYAQDQGPRGTVLDFRLPIELDKVRISPGDILFGDRDGVCVIPSESEEEVITAALEKVAGEQLVRKAIKDGMSAVDAFAKYGIM